jgi:hypothetical protein
MLPGAFFVDVLGAWFLVLGSWFLVLGLKSEDWSKFGKAAREAVQITSPVSCLHPGSRPFTIPADRIGLCGEFSSFHLWPLVGRHFAPA